MSYKHFTRNERNFIEENLKLGYSRRYIAKKLGRHHSSVCDEINRNSDENGEYRAFHADFECAKRRVYREYTSKDMEFLIGYVKEKILLTWSPEQISNRLKLEYPNDKRKQISTNKVYSMIYRRQIPDITRKNLRKKGKQYIHTHWDNKFEDAINVRERCEEANNRSEIGHWEIDSVVSRKSKSRLGTFVDRKSRFVLISLLANGTAEEFNYGATKKFLHISKNKRKTFTCDNGSEFAEHIELSRILELKTYFTDKHAPWQKPTNENTNGLIREFYPKKFDFSTITQEEVDRVAELINNRPRKCLGWRTALEVFFNLSPRITR